MRRPRAIPAILAALTLLAAACGDDDDAGGGGGNGGGGDDVLQVAFVYVGPIGDAGWTKRHDDGRKAVEEALGDRVETTFVESVAEGAPSERTFEDLARQGNDLIFGTSFGYMDQMLAVAEEYPDVVFMHATGFKVADNMGTYFGAAEEARYLSGIAAGNATTSGTIGYVAAFPIPEVLRGINAFTLGVRSVNPAATVQVSWTSTWFGPEIEKTAAETLLDTGVDVIAQHQDTPSPGEAAGEAGAYWVGYNDDMSRFAPDAWLTGPIWDWGPYYIRTAEQVLDGTWESEQYYGTMADGLVSLAPFGDAVDQATRDLIDQTRAEIEDGTFQPFTGPIKAQDGTVKVPDGTSATLEELLSMDYFVEGVIGSATG
ncbi:MAG: BMP family ABC transporter substrate-binding protein [Acidimicrobiales bacterium]